MDLSLHTLAPRLALVIWGLGMTVLSSSYLASHLLTLPVPAADDPQLARGVAQATAPVGA